MKTVEFYEYVIGNVENEEVKAFAETQLAKYEKAQETRKAYTERKNAEKNAARDAVREKVVAVLTNEPKTATTLIEEAGVEISRQAIAPLLKPLIEAGTVTKEPVTIAGAKGKQVGYKLS